MSGPICWLRHAEGRGWEWRVECLSFRFQRVSSPIVGDGEVLGDRLEGHVLTRRALTRRGALRAMRRQVRRIRRAAKRTEARLARQTVYERVEP